MNPNRTFPLDISWRMLITDAGLQPERVLRMAGLPDDLFARTERSLDTEEYFRFWLAIENEARDTAFPLNFIERLSVEVFSPPLFAALCSSNMMQAVQRLAKYKQLIAPMALETAVSRDGELLVSPCWLTSTQAIPQSVQIAELAFLLKLLRMATRTPVQALNVTLTIRPLDAQVRHFSRFFGCVMSYGEKPSVSFSAVDVHRPFLTVNEGMWQIFEPELKRRLSQLDETATTTERVRAVLLELLPGSEASIEKTAERLGMSKRTLQRRLGEEGESFRSLVNTSREKLARHYLCNTGLSGYEIAFLLGFEDPNSFYRAFMSWTGLTPEKARDSLLLN